MSDDRAGPLGAALVIASAAVFSLSGVLTKLIASDAWTIVCWRGLIGGLLIALYVAVRQGGAVGRAFRLGWSGWLLATVGSAASIAFIAAFKLTYVANVAIIYATVPFAAALLDRVLTGAGIRHATMVTASVSFLGVAVMVAGGLGTGQLLGDAIALLMTMGNALYMVMIRALRDTPVVWAGAASALQLFLIGWIMSDPLAVPAADLWLLILFGAVFALALILWTEGTRLVSAADSALLGSAETPLAILFAFLILAELPPGPSLVGGAIVLTAVFGHAVRDARKAF